MRITKQRLKEIIKEELKNSQNEGMFDKLKAMVGFGHKFWDTHIPALERGYRSVLAPYGGPDGVLDERSAVIKKAYDEMTEFFLDWANKAKKGTDTRDWWLTMSGKQDRKYEAIREKYRAIQAGMLQAWVKGAENEMERAEAKRAYDRLMAQKEDDERNREEAERERRSAAAREKAAGKDPTKERPNRGLGLAYGDARSEKERYGESKITKSALKSLIAEELTKAEEERKAELEKELDDLKHK